ncbi:MAG: efflux RND transporter periplasmic adaptor subunit [Elusimicrobia bacterium]|nr:efflux RND transporter periplasmic adaptor subunit [Elusimicrobiota bacterium]
MKVNRTFAAMLAAGTVTMVCAGLVWSNRENAPALAGAPQAMIAATGRIECRREASVRSKVHGRVRRFARIEGDWTREGEAVAFLDDGAERAAKGEAEAEVFKTCAFFGRVKVLHEKGVASAQELDDADAGLRLAAARLERARAALDDRVVRAPFDGRILKTYLENGETADPSSPLPLFMIGDDRSLKVTAEVDELDIGRLVEGRSAQVLPDAYPGESFPGKVVKVGRMLGRKSISSEDPAERMDAKVLEVEVELAPSERLKRGLSVQVRIHPKTT